MLISSKTLFADDTYSKPYLVTYVNTAFFILPLIPILVQRAYEDPSQLRSLTHSCRKRLARYTPLAQPDEARDDEEGFLKPDSPRLQRQSSNDYESETMQASQVLSMRSLKQAALPPLTIRETSWLSLEFCLLWFMANYFVAACLEYTTVASSTILTSTSSIFTLLFGTIFRVEKFTLKKSLGVLASLAGIVLISTVDLSGSNDKNRGSFPHKSSREIALGDGMALVSAVLYGIYAVMMKKRIGDERRISMPLFFGLVGLWNVLILWPGFFILHWSGVERFELPTEGRVILIILVNSISSLVSDIAWAYAVLLTSPIVVTVGLSTTIPLSLIGQILLNSQHASFVYWSGAGVVLLSFFFVNHEEAKEDEQVLQAEERENAVLGGPVIMEP
ncbi:hypothetical protein BDV97DRAFT_359780 [Delphinella strobiligena]|nr:hypothetical protein BDV97DRAFT_359780 [Delphinella strobiligena]